jgi:hypothetical protein
VILVRVEWIQNLKPDYIYRTIKEFLGHKLGSGR